MEDFSTVFSFSPIDQGNPNREMLELTDIIISQIDLTDIYGPFQPNTKEYIFYSVPCGTFSKTDHILQHKASLKRFKDIEKFPETYQTTMD